MKDFSKIGFSSRSTSSRADKRGGFSDKTYRRERDPRSPRDNRAERGIDRSSEIQPVRLITTKSGVSERVMHEEQCRVLEKCGSCPTLDISYKSQLMQKTADLKSRVQKAGSDFSTVVIKDCVESEDRLGYRHNVKLVVSERMSFGGRSSQKEGTKRWIDLGFYRQSLNEVVDIGRCPIQSNTMNDIMGWLRTGIRLHNVSVYTLKNKTGLLQNVVIRTSRHTRQAILIFIVTKADLATLRPLARDIAEKYMNVQGIYMQVVTPGRSAQNEDEKINDNLTLIVGQDLLEEKFGNFVFKFSAASFMSINPMITNRIYSRIEELLELTGKETVVDLYSGAGGISLTLAQSAREVIGIDHSTSSIKDALRNAKINEVKNVDFYEGKVDEVLQKLNAEKRLQKADVVILNPARSGCEGKTIEHAVGLEPKTIVYLSTFFDILFRDLKSFKKAGYEPTIFEPFDTAPGTNNYEVLCYLTKK